MFEDEENDVYVSWERKIRMWSQNAKPEVLLLRLTSLTSALKFADLKCRSQNAWTPIPSETYPVMSKRASTHHTQTCVLVLVLWL
jgi:hypothetical protein